MEVTTYRVLFLLGFIVLTGAGCVQSTPTEPIIDREAIIFDAKQSGLIMSDDEVAIMAAMVTDVSPETESTESIPLLKDAFTHTAALADVTGGESFGLAYARQEDGVYQLRAEMGGLPVPAEGFFYEGWIVRRGKNISAISTGRIEQIEDTFLNLYQSSEDLLKYNFYVLTLEPDDGDPAPAEHILEGTFEK